MTKVVRSLPLLVKGVQTLWKKVYKPVAKSKLGKIAIAAAAMYFGVPAVTGAFGAGATGTVMGNLSAAWGGLSSAAGSALAGNLAQAGSQLGAGMLGGGSAMAAAGGGAGAASSMLAGAPALAAAPQATTAASMFANPYLAPSLVQAGGQIIQGIGGAVSQREFQRREDEKEDDARKRYNTNVGTRLWPKG